MPISEYYGGHGERVMKDMRKKYGNRAKEIFYATANKRRRRAKNAAKDAIKQ
jgi:hypothetical protein